MAPGDVDDLLEPAGGGSRVRERLEEGFLNEVVELEGVLDVARPFQVASQLGGILDRVLLETELPIRPEHGAVGGRCSGASLAASR